MVVKQESLGLQKLCRISPQAHILVGWLLAGWVYFTSHYV